MNSLKKITKFCLNYAKRFPVRRYTQNTQKGISPKLIESADKDKLVEFLAQHYYPYEPLNVSLRVERLPDAVSEQSEFYASHAIQDKCSYMLVNNENKIVAVILNKIETRSMFTPWKCKNPHVCTLAKFYNHVYLECMVTKKFDTDKFLNIEVVAVDLNYVGKGLSQWMVTLTKDYAKNNKIKLITLICTSNYTALSAMKAGFLEAYKLHYVDYHVEGKQVFNPKPPHKEVVVFALSIFVTQ
ncbi:arylalkylamine N-acetyltransferase 1-like [Onthophagus taurus]|uniref:arylalkylamine N-acetyltransferase 1-like n=1 Tax=Onthophagus taurus TaxID=166361 RepID=UPI000C20E492|nr:dopamine N-acetyltransferase-like [Onthophagus taurus]